MRKCWLTAAAIAAAASVAEGADVQIFGIHTPSTNNWAVYARISNSASVNGNGTQVSGLSSITLDMLNNTVDGTGSATVNTSTNQLPSGTSKYSDADFNPLQYGFWLFRSNGTVDASGAHDIRAGQYVEYEVPTSTPPYQRLVLPGIGQTSGSTAVNADFNSATAWGSPVLVAKGTYTPSATTGAGSTVGLKINRDAKNIPNLLFDTDPTAGIAWQLEPAVGVSVVDARTFTSGSLVLGDTTVKAGPGDANLDGTVDFNDLVALAQNYNVASGRTWFNGDFNYDGAVDFGDLVLLAQQYNQPVPSSPQLSGAFEADLAAAFAAVPEPGAVGLMVAGIGALGVRRRAREISR
jgi:hypothetical protein